MLPVGTVANFPVCCWEDKTPPPNVPAEYQDFFSHRILWGIVAECCYSSDFEKLGFYIQVLAFDNEIDESRVYPEKRFIKVSTYQKFFLCLL